MELAQDVTSVDQYIVAHGYGNYMLATAADDMEPAWDPSPGGVEAGNTRDLLAGYNASASASLYDYGSAEGGYWNTNTMADIAWGINVAAGNRSDYPWDYPVPEIYYASQPPQWEAIDCYDHQHGVAMAIWGVMTEQPTSGTYSYQAAYDAMMNALVNGCSGATSQSGINFSTNI